MGGRDTSEHPDAELERLFDEVRCGERRLEDVPDRRMRDAIRLALSFGRVAEGPTAQQRSRMRGRVLGALRPSAPGLSDRLLALFALLAKPAPYLARALAVASIIVGLAGSATVASAESLPDETLYDVKLAGEQVRLAVAITPVDRASVYLSIAGHRLAEATALAERARDDDTLVAAVEYATALANAAAELAAEPTSPQTTELVTQLDARLARQRIDAVASGARLATSPRTASSGAILLALAAPGAPSGGDAHMVRIAANAATVSDALVALAVARAAASSARLEDAARRVPAPTPSASTRSVAPTPTAPVGAAAERAAIASGTARPSAARTAPSGSAAEIAAFKARLEAEKAHQAAERARQAAQRTPAPTRTPSPTPTRR